MLQKDFSLNEEERKKTIFLHFGAVDYESFVYINGQLVTTHIGGYSSFKADITKYVTEGENTIFVIAEDDLRSSRQPAGKQSDRFDSYGCLYTRTTGIWQTVWLEFLPESYIKSAKYYPDTENGTLTIIGSVCGSGELRARVSFEGKAMGETIVKANNSLFTMQIKPDELYLWEPGHGRLYDLELTFGADSVKSYFGMRNIRLDGRKLMLNGQSVFQRFVLDQDFIPTAFIRQKQTMR